MYLKTWTECVDAKAGLALSWPYISYFERPHTQSCINPCTAEWIKMPCPLLIFSQADYLIWIVAINSHTQWQTVQIQVSWLLQKSTDLDLHCLQRQGISGFSRTRVKSFLQKKGQDIPVTEMSIMWSPTDPDKMGYQKNIFFISQQKHILWVFIRRALVGLKWVSQHIF